jgi:hypothetical protein
LKQKKVQTIYYYKRKQYHLRKKTNKEAIYFSFANENVSYNNGNNKELVVLIKATILTESELIAVLKWVGPLEDVWARGGGPRCNPFGQQGTHLSTSLLVLGGVGALRPDVPITQRNGHAPDQTRPIE